LVKQANAVLARLVELSPGDAHARHNLAVSCFKLKRMREGVRHCRKALKIKPDYPLALYNLALAQMRLGRRKRARRFAARALALAPKDANIRRLWRRLGIGGIWAKLMGRILPRRSTKHAD
ncbi:unnamed protein product, partial [marine sediment metagenome]